MIARGKSTTRACIDAPTPDETVAADGFTVSGWAFREDGARLVGVSALVDGRRVGGTRLTFARADVALAFGLSHDTTCGFAFRLAGLPTDARCRIAFEARFDATVENIGAVDVRISPFDARKEHFGTLAEPDYDRILGRADVYGVGPPSSVADPHCVANVLRYVAPNDRVLDVGCGIGAYADPLAGAGIRWHGCEVVPEFVDDMRARGLDVTQSLGARLPFDDASFDLAICIEVLEHIDAYEAFAAEIARVARRGALFSVPNCGTIPRYAPLGVVPWHILESTHVNFFTASSLRRFLERFFATVETIEYGRLPIDAGDGTPAHNHVFAVAMHERHGD